MAFELMGGLSPVGISIFNSGVFPKSAESLEKITSNFRTTGPEMLSCVLMLPLHPTI